MTTIRDVPASRLRTHLGAVLDAVRAGDTIAVTHRGERIARIVPEAGAADRRRQAAAAIDAFRAARKGQLPRLSVDDLTALVEEGRQA